MWSHPGSTLECCRAGSTEPPTAVPELGILAKLLRMNRLQHMLLISYIICKELFLLQEQLGVSLSFLLQLLPSTLSITPP